jgi:hypothetical protein
MNVMKKLLRWILFQLWKLQFKKINYPGPKGYHCRYCIGATIDCGDFPCPCKPEEKLVVRFTWIKYNQLLNKLNTKLL